ncbi:hypothetical protein Halru_1834 [Halovivax ruber XH-70]|uniref:DUF2071 domain-containing protein n=1 Tax=Halovivax ruber (strain DSM 18193 / JCM 13892 / XH-70) TaxID=797302 RepID=L0IC83_HALRX|nr:DUF2071 domain-containing protein [Halovivax ruber]AGB16433.1 hypothetical protein Halru_1834 [Halovivax ruber XH-70]
MVVPLAMGWRHLLFENWPIEPAVMDAHLPDGLAPDVYDGSAWLSIVPFTNVAVRPRGVPESLGIRLPEINVRTYVTHARVPSVYFFSLDAQGIASVLGARIFHHLPYFYARISLDRNDDRIRFRSRRHHPGARPARYAGTYRPTGDPFSAPEEPFADFLVERYRFYTEAQDESLRYTDVEHEPWTLYPAEATIDWNTLFSAHGFETPEVEPSHYYSPGLDVIASRSNSV